ncbi:MAG: tRNA preQ1(34) S-adenosylmethionine ribosyltransferase-isomerase QueA [Spirochaetales bacterium]|nr:tRNA preQ1(34) S-adenosylmethionine ribosyltransferase-isomerase QueA [Spirochaetales bacterium]
MKTSDFYFNLPEELIAQHPVSNRGESRMMVLNRVDGGIEHKMIGELPDLIDSNTFIVMNNSRVRKARIYGESDTGGKVEFLLLEKRPDNQWLAMATKAKKQTVGKHFSFPAGINAKVAGTEEQYRILEFETPIDDDYLDIHGHIPLPPYIRREDAPADSERYQTVYSESMGSVAAPTAGLHFTDELLGRLREVSAGVEFVTLHVGLGTFLPVRTEKVTEHKMHSERYEVSERTAAEINAARSSGKKILAVGTTSVRTLESSCKDGFVRAGEASTDIFIYPGYEFQVVDKLITNFHTPESSLLMLVSAFAGRDSIMNSYMRAIDERYRFFSYGDAMFIR